MIQPNSAPKSSARSWAKAIIFMVVISVTILCLRKVKSDLEQARRTAMEASPIIWVDGTTDRALQQAFAADDEASVARRLREVPRSALRPDMVPRLAKDKRVHSLEALLKAGWSPEGIEGNGKPLVAAVQTGQLKAAELLLRYRANPNARGEYDAPALLIATFRYEPYLPMVKLLLDHKADPNLTSHEVFSMTQTKPDGSSAVVERHWKRRPIDSVISRGDAKALELLLRHGAKSEPIEGMPPPLVRAAAHRLGLPLVKLLLSHGAKLNVVGDLFIRVDDKMTLVRATPLYAAVKLDRIETARYLLAQGADPSQPCDKGLSPLDIAKEPLASELRAAARK